MDTLSALPFHNVAGKGIRADEFLESRAIGVEDGMAVSGPFYGTFVYETDMVAYFEHGVHVMGIYNRRHVELRRELADKFIYEYGSVGIQSGVRLVAEEVFRAEGYGSGYAHTLLHAAGKLGWILVVAAGDVHLLQAELRPLEFLCIRPVREKIHREHHVFEHGGEIEQCTALEENADVLVKGLSLLLIHSHKAVPVIEYVPRIGLEKPYEILQQHGLAAAALPYYHIAPAVGENGIDIVQNLSAVKPLAKTPDLYHILVKHHFRDNKVKQKYEYAARHYGAGAAATHTEGPAAGIIALECGYTADYEAEQRGLETTVKHIEPIIAVLYALHIGGRAYDAREFDHYISAYKAENETKKHKKGAEHGRGKNLGPNEESGGIYTHHIHGIYLLRYTHAAKFGCNVGPHFPGEDEGDHRGAELQNQAFPDHIPHIHLVYERIFEIGRSLYHKDTAYENGYYGDYENGGYDQFVRLHKELFPIQSGLLRAAEDPAQKQEILSDFFYRRFYHNIAKILIKN